MKSSTITLLEVVEMGGAAPEGTEGDEPMELTKDIDDATLRAPGPNRGWLCAYMAQMNPLFGPQIGNATLLVMKREWGGGKMDVSQPRVRGRRLQVIRETMS
ncbi:unnamed protein product [Darwinula stevensoni]|uniref:Uncharacterized protein n=1 Tax=Darwinula stevensoni TaxID=69355 RepID=A0A7R9A4Z4_9CRUS|nr:unnamed protein product [Darwinula stevensoni]CAG0890954.1 unnamed protein product [Darwinula stevensoni]